MRDFVDLLQDEHARAERVRERLPSLGLHDGQLGLVWRSSPNKDFRLPAVVLVNEAERHQFFAWAETYLGALRPPTAHFRVLTPHEFELALSASSPPGLGRSRNPVVGLILAELQFLLRGRTGGSQTGLATHLATHAFALGRLASLYGKNAHLRSTSAAWFESRSMTGHTDMPQDSMLEPWSILCELGLPAESPAPLPANRDIIVKACREIGRDGLLSDATWGVLNERRVDMLSPHDMLAMPREKRIALVDSALARHRGSPGRDNCQDFLLGYLLSQVAPGDFLHAHLVKNDENMPSLLWYGVCAGLHPEFGLGDDETPLRYLIVRELQRAFDVLDNPESDVALQELRELRASPEALRSLRIDGGPIEIELVPGVSTRVRPPVTDGPTKSTREQAHGPTQQELYGGNRRSGDRERRK